MHELSSLQMDGLCDGFQVEAILKSDRLGFSIRVKGPCSEDRYKYKGMKPGNSSRMNAQLNRGVVGGRQKLTDYYIHIMQHGSEPTPRLTFSAMGYGKAVTLVDVDEIKFDEFLKIVKEKFTDMEPRLREKAIDLKRKYEANHKQRSSSPWGAPLTLEGSKI